MSTQPNILKASLLLAAIAIATVLASCQPEGLVFDPQSGQWVSPLPTPTSPISPLPTPTVTSGPTPTPPPTPWPPDFTPEPTATSTPPADPLLIYDPVNRFSLRLLPGWHAYVGGTTVIFNYDDENFGGEGNFPFGGLKIQIGVGEFESEQSFEQWLSNWIAVSTAPRPGSSLPSLTATEPLPYTLGEYEGVTYFIDANPRIMEIVLPLTDGRIIVIGLTPAGSTALSDGLSILSTLEISP